MVMDPADYRWSEPRGGEAGSLAQGSGGKLRIAGQQAESRFRRERDAEEEENG